jgi:hypothetical protein
MNTLLSTLKTKGYLYQDKSLIKQENEFFQKVIKKNFSKNVDYYNNLSTEKFRQIALKARNQMQKSREM